MLQDLLRKKGMWIAWLLMNDLVGTGTNIQAAESPTGFFLRLGIHSFAKKNECDKQRKHISHSIHVWYIVPTFS